MATPVVSGIVFSAKTADFTSNGISVEAYSQISFHFLAESISSGNGVFSIEGSNDGTNWITGLAFQDATATASATWVASKTLSSNTSAGGYLPTCGFKMLRVKLDMTTDGSYSCFINARLSQN